MSPYGRHTTIMRLNGVDITHTQCAIHVVYQWQRMGSWITCAEGSGRGDDMRRRFRQLRTAPDIRNVRFERVEDYGKNFQ